MVFVIRPTDRTGVAQGFFRRVQAHGRSPDTSCEHKNASGPVGISLKKAAPLALGDKPTHFKKG